MRMAPSGSSGAENSSASKNVWESFDLAVLQEEEPSSSSETKSEGTGSVNQPATRPCLNPSASREEEAGPSNRTLPVVPYPYQSDEEIGGDCVRSIKQRFLRNSSFPSYYEIERARIKAEDLFEVKVQIIQTMQVLHPEGDWMGRGARALDNPHTPTGESSLGKLSAQLNDLRQEGVQSQTFASLRSKVSTRINDLDEDSRA